MHLCSSSNLQILWCCLFSSVSHWKKGCIMTKRAAGLCALLWLPQTHCSRHWTAFLFLNFAFPLFPLISSYFLLSCSCLSLLKFVSVNPPFERSVPVKEPQLHFACFFIFWFVSAQTCLFWYWIVDSDKCDVGDFGCNCHHWHCCGFLWDIQHRNQLPCTQLRDFL